MQFDGSDIFIGEMVHDIVFGSGTVQHLLEGEKRVVVDFGGRHYSYNAAGQGHFPMKTLYWRDPIGGFIPMKDSKKWDHFVEMRKAIAQVIWGSNAVRDKL